MSDVPLPPRRSGVLNWADVRRVDPCLVDRLAVNMYRTDEVADRVADELLATQDGWRVLDHVLADAGARLGDAPSALRDMLAAVLEPPPWYEPAVVDAGARAWWRFGSVQSITLYQSLLYGYQSPGLTRPLALTGRLTSGTSKRLAETGRWVVRATAPGGMAPGAAGWAETVRIRLVHAVVRRHLLAHGWDSDGWGAPINHTYGALTISGGFLVLPLVVAKDLGIRYSWAEHEAITAQWRWIGHVIGVPDDLLPESFTAAKELFDIAARLEIEPDRDSRDLTDALLHHNYALEALPGTAGRLARAALQPLLASSFSSISTRWVPPNAARGIGLRRTAIHHVVDLARPVIRLREAARVLGLLGGEHALAERELRFVVANLDRFDVRAPLHPADAA